MLGLLGSFALGSHGPVADVALGVVVETRCALELLPLAPETGVVALAVARNGAVATGRATLLLNI